MMQNSEHSIDTAANGVELGALATPVEVARRLRVTTSRPSDFSL
jgi:hypothetical protein